MSNLIQGYEVVIGFETHAQLSTQSKIFSRASTAFGAEPNTQACAVDLALPGTLPVMNKGAVERAIQFGLAIGAHIAPRSIFARKNYFYPDLPKGYQISQFEIPVVQGGEVEFFLDGEKRSVRLVRAHLEEDAGKSLHEDASLGGGGMSGIDLNRAGTPLLEIVTEPDMRSSAEAVAYAKELHKIVTWIGICDGNMQEGSFRCDANVSVRKPGAELGTRREIKNLNSFKFMQQAIDYEVRWQIEQIEDGHAIQQATVLFNPDTGETRAMRTKEDAADYRYFPDPDLPPLVIADEWVAQIRSEMTELPRVMAARFVADYGLSEYDATTLTQSKVMATYFEAVVEACGQAKLASNWITGEVSRRLNLSALGIEHVPVPPAHLGSLLSCISKGEISNNAGKLVLEALWEQRRAVAGSIHDFTPHELTQAAEIVHDIIERLGLRQMNDSSELEKIVDGVLAANPKNVEEYKSGNTKALNALVGQIMKGSKGKANPQQVNDLLRQKLG
jgi:aspartyl-tRNA(Asn)/glutamyl-tRNA(Gln) amidotransferase subunit B